MGWNPDLAQELVLSLRYFLPLATGHKDQKCTEALDPFHYKDAANMQLPDQGVLNWYFNVFLSFELEYTRQFPRTMGTITQKVAPAPMSLLF